MHQDFALQRIAVFDVRQDQHADIDFPTDQQMLNIGPLVFNHLNSDVGVCRFKALKQLDQKVARYQTGHTDGQLAGQAFGSQLQTALGVVHRGKDQI
ncbi:hypothetical protein D3C71_1635710 [compost metagenome]